MIPEVGDKDRAVLLSAVIEVISKVFKGEEIMFLYQFSSCCKEFINNFFIACWISCINLFLKPAFL